MFSVIVWDAQQKLLVQLVLIGPIWVSCCSNVRSKLAIKSKGRCFFCAWSMCSVRWWVSPNAAPPRDLGDRCYIWGNRIDLGSPRIVSSDRAQKDDIMIHEELKRKLMTSQRRCVSCLESLCCACAPVFFVMGLGVNKHSDRNRRCGSS